MTYIPDLEYDFDKEPFRDNFGTYLIEFALGYDLSTNAVILMSVMLVPEEDGHDLCFGIREKDLVKTWKVSAPDFSVESRDKYIPRSNRPFVLKLLLRAIEELVTGVEVNPITMQTFYPNLPDDAMKKYSEVCSIMESCGYETADTYRDGTNGKNYWLFKKLE